MNIYKEVVPLLSGKMNCHLAGQHPTNQLTKYSRRGSPQPLLNYLELFSITSAKHIKWSKIQPYTVYVISFSEDLDVTWLKLLHFPSPDLYLDYHTGKTSKNVGSAWPKPGNSCKMQQMGKVITIIYVAQYSNVSSSGALPKNRQRGA